MKRIEIEVPRENREAVHEIAREYGEDVTVSEVEKEDRPFVQFEFIVDSEDIDALATDVKAVKNLERGELTIEVFDEVAYIEKGERRRG
ncbi:MAG: hypothetical protein SVU32_04910, partial [Candidatus Nanohaloarchaea archaeon]|nr:hypothetical protein [Candidatus Nanohaloarchaea archaeon]